jgi:hypothetical protein
MVIYKWKISVIRFLAVFDTTKVDKQFFTDPNLEFMSYFVYQILFLLNKIILYLSFTQVTTNYISPFYLPLSPPRGSLMEKNRQGPVSDRISEEENTKKRKTILIYSTKKISRKSFSFHRWCICDVWNWSIEFICFIVRSIWKDQWILWIME